MHLEALGDQAVMVYCEDESQATQLGVRMQHARPTWCIDVVQAYVSVAVFYDVTMVDFDQVAEWLTNHRDKTDPVAGNPSRLHVVPCCYELGLD